jgi:hypothetical protein
MSGACREYYYISLFQFHTFTCVPSDKNGSAARPYTQDFMRVAMIVVVIKYAALPVAAPAMTLKRSFYFIRILAEDAFINNNRQLLVIWYLSIILKKKRPFIHFHYELLLLLEFPAYVTLYSIEMKH